MEQQSGTTSPPVKSSYFFFSKFNLDSEVILQCFPLFIFPYQSFFLLYNTDSRRFNVSR